MPSNSDFLWQFSEKEDDSFKSKWFLSKQNASPTTLVKTNGKRISGAELASKYSLTPEELVLEADTILEVSEAPEETLSNFSPEGITEYLKLAGYKFKCPDCGRVYFGKDEFEAFVSRYGWVFVSDLFGGFNGIGALISFLLDVSSRPDEISDVLGLEYNEKTHTSEPVYNCIECRAKVYP